MASDFDRFVCPHCYGTFQNPGLGLMRESHRSGGAMIMMTSNPNAARDSTICPLCGKEIALDVLFEPPKASAGGTAGCIVLGLIAALVVFFLFRSCGQG